jgi:hypothetical protein
MIVKVQRPLFTTGVPEVLIYDRTRAIEITTPYSNAWESWFGDEFKRYARAHYKGSILVIDRIVADRAW